jgi:hypothetical protein
MVDELNARLMRKLGARAVKRMDPNFAIEPEINRSIIYPSGPAYLDWPMPRVIEHDSVAV